MATSRASTEEDFREAMLDVYRRAKDECNYRASRFLDMVLTRGAVETAKVLATETPSEGYVRLWECGRLDLTVEKQVLDEKYSQLFTTEEKDKAKARLEAYGYDGL
jgi:hypothetical protein